MISQAVNLHGYSQMEIARHLKLHYSTVSRLIKSVNEEQRYKDPDPLAPFSIRGKSTPISGTVVVYIGGAATYPIGVGVRCESRLAPGEAITVVNSRDE